MTEQFVPPLARTLPALVLEAAQRHAGRVFVEDGDIVVDYADLPARAFEVSRALIAHGIAAGDRVAIWAPNRAEWLLAALGIHCAGAVMVPINTRMKGLEAADILERSGSRVLFVVDDFLGTDYPAMLADCRPANLEKVVAIGASGVHCQASVRSATRMMALRERGLADTSAALGLIRSSATSFMTLGGAKGIRRS